MTRFLKLIGWGFMIWIALTWLVLGNITCAQWGIVRDWVLDHFGADHPSAKRSA